MTEFERERKKWPIMPRNEVASIGWHRDAANVNPHRGTGKAAGLADHCATARVSDIPTERLRCHPESAVAIGGLSLGRSANAKRPAGSRRACRVELWTSGENLTPLPPSLRRKGEPKGGLTPPCLTAEGFCPEGLNDLKGRFGRGVIVPTRPNPVKATRTFFRRVPCPRLCVGMAP